MIAGIKKSILDTYQTQLLWLEYKQRGAIPHNKPKVNTMKTLTQSEKRIHALIEGLRDEIEGVYINNIYKSLKEMGREDIEIETDCQGWQQSLYEQMGLIKINLQDHPDEILATILEEISDTDGMAEIFMEWDREEQIRKEDKQ